ncbi:hypothetical protein scyTo_0000943 [Scyliorhinus torazame]|uniref:DH domain-containing protein n=1 Tax=Scyliorhinus torazame TaxID=75743 RepID=A0A401P6M5_SCYTO|nr:hypothetical protein [Scyliorhinus torazame]
MVVYGEKEEPNETGDESLELDSQSISKPDTLVLETSQDNIESHNNLIISEMLQSLSILEQKESTIVKKHRAMRHGGKLIRGLSGRNMTISLQSRTGHTHMPSVVGVLVFTQFWFWFPHSHFLSLAFTPTAVIGLNKDLKMPKVQYRSNCKPSTFAYPAPLEVPKEKEKEKVSTAVLSITAKAKKKEKEKEKEKGKEKEEEKMDVEETEKKDEDKEKEKKKEPEPSSQLLENPARVMPAQLKVLIMPEGCRYQPFKPKEGFLQYAVYCNNHVTALSEWARLIVVEKYAYFFEVCRRHQHMMSLPFDGFLLMPVQKICKYPLLLTELLKATPPEHRDYKSVEAAVVAMKDVLNAINSQKGEDETEDKILKLQRTILNWQGADLSVISTQLLQRGDLIVIPRPRARAKHVFALLFDHQMILCKKDLLKRNTLYFKERIKMDTGIVKDLDDGRDEEFDCKVRNAIKLTSKFPDKPSKLFFTKNLADKQLWLHAFEEERQISEGELDADASYYDFPALNVSTVTQEQLSFLAQPKRRKANFWRKFANKPASVKD